MSQKRVTEYFTNRKKCSSVNPSKKQKIQFEENVSSAQIIQSNTRGKHQSGKSIISSKLTEIEKIKPACSKRQPTVRKSQRTTSHKDCVEESKLGTIIAVPSSACDSHMFSPAMTPKKLGQPGLESLTGMKKRARGGEVPVCVDQFTDTETPSKGFDFSLYHEVDQEEGATGSARKRLSLKRSPKIQDADKVFLFGEHVVKTSDVIEKQNSSMKMTSVPECNDKTSGMTRSGVSKDELLKTTTVQEPVIQKKAEKKNKLTAEDLKSKLSKCGGIADLKQKLMEFERSKKEAAASIKSKVYAPLKEDGVRGLDVAQATATDAVLVAPGDNQPDVTRKPAYERHHGLVAAVPPTLTLPCSFQVLRDMFTSADTTVSMLARRFEVCTIQKLTEAVQTMTKRAFETKHLGQIKTVYPTAYSFRQEKNLHRAGIKTSEYQLTIEANLADCSTGVNSNDKADPRPSFTIDKLLTRRSTFYSNLINIVKRFHREFLVKLNIGGSHGDDEISRWHPRFNVDAVPEILPSELPKAPDEQVLRTAKDVLQEAQKSHNELNPILRRALEKVASLEKNTSSTSQQPVSTSSVVSATSSSTIKGIPQSLLDKIREKEAKKLASAMVRRPEQDKRISMLERLPELMRILRGQFITKKKPALPMKDCCQCLIDSSKSYLSPVETEAHLKLIAELVPELITLVVISAGVYVKLDVNASLSSLIDKVQAHHKRMLIA